MPGIRVEKLTASIVISRFMRRATSVKRSIWKPSTPPPSLGMACGAKVPSTPVLSGGSLSWASAGPAQRRAARATRAERRRIIMSLPKRSWSSCVPGPVHVGVDGAALVTARMKRGISRADPVRARGPSQTGALRRRAAIGPRAHLLRGRADALAGVNPLAVEPHVLHAPEAVQRVMRHQVLHVGPVGEVVDTPGHRRAGSRLDELLLDRVHERDPLPEIQFL